MLIDVRMSPYDLKFLTGSLKSRPQNRNQSWSSPHSASELTDECELHPQIVT